MLQRPAGQIAQTIRQIGIIAADQSVETETAILAERYFPQQKIAERIHSHDVGYGPGRTTLPRDLLILSFSNRSQP